MEPVGNIYAEQVAGATDQPTIDTLAPIGVADQAPEESLPAGMWSFGGGKGGVGKSIISCAVAYWLGRTNHKVVLVDADLGAANLHTLLGIRVPKCTLEDFLLHRVEDLGEALLPTPFENVRLLAGGYDVAALANPNYGQKTRVLRALRRLHADHILVDLGAGSSLNVLDFFLACQNRCIVLSPQPTSVQNAYGFVKSALYRQINRIVARTPDALRLLNEPSGSGRPTMTVPQLVDEIAAIAPQHRTDLAAALAAFQVNLVVNMVHGPRDEQTAQVVQGVCKRYLGIDISVLGSVQFDPAVQRWASTMDPNCFAQAGLDGARRATHDIAMRMVPEQAQAKAA
jgi:flagellar biosynthesis protein FlhG